MGVYLAKPRTEKESDDGGNDLTSFGVTAMQGWRQAMEDAHLAIPDFEDEMGVYGVFDGHGGAAVSKWVSLHFEDVFRRCLTEMREKSAAGELPAVEGFTSDWVVVAEALQKTFLLLDVEMQYEDNLSELSTIHNDAEAKRQSVREEVGNEEEASSQFMPHYLLQALLQQNKAAGGNAAASGGKPMLRIVEQDGQHWVQLLADEDETMDEETACTEGEMDFGSPQRASVEIEDVTDEEEAKVIREAIEENTDEDNKAEQAEAPLQTEAEKMPAEKLMADPKHSAELAESSADGPTVDPCAPSSEGSESKSQEVDDESMEVQQSDSEPKVDEFDDDKDDIENYQALNDLDGPRNTDEEEVSKMDPSRPDCCGATAVVVVVVSGKNPFIIAANAGDSRAVLCRGNRAMALTEDHKPQLAHEAERINKAGGAVLNGRVDGNLNLSRSLGDLYYKRDTTIPQKAQRISAFPDIRVVPLAKNDEFVLLACDGIWDCMENQQAINFVQRRRQEVATGPEDTDTAPIATTLKKSQICEDVCDRCLAENPVQSEGIGCDNMTVLILDLKQVENLEPTDDEEVKLYPTSLTPQPSDRPRPLEGMDTSEEASEEVGSKDA
eukprot:GHVO01034253.1.p1 GENE.GHVO01034253.1~~GHVO01034253.1.p1  ORF type:complete len:643 (+),score=114.07 GHVO01034253.1:100-1929(+)